MEAVVAMVGFIDRLYFSLMFLFLCACKAVLAAETVFRSVLCVNIMQLIGTACTAKLLHKTTYLIYKLGK